MGYRSDVAYKIKFEDAETMALFLAEVKAKEEYKRALDDIMEFKGRNGLEINEDRLYISYYMTNIKWYDEYPEVQAHEGIVELAREYRNDHDKKIEFAFARIGEEMEDNDNWASDDGYHLVWISRQVMFDED